MPKDVVVLIVLVNRLTTLYSVLTVEGCQVPCSYSIERMSGTMFLQYSKDVRYHMFIQYRKDVRYYFPITVQ